MGRGRVRTVAAGVALAVVAVLLPAGGAEATVGRFRVEAISTRPDTVTGGDVLIAVDVPWSVPVRKVQVLRNGEDVTDRFRPDPADRRRLVGLVDDLVEGENTVEARRRGHGFGHWRSDRLTVVDHPLTGPVFSGPHQEPFVCRTAEHGLGEPLDDDCSAPTQVTYVYRTTGGTFEDLPDPAVRPDDLATTTTWAGEEVDYVVRVETGTLNRAVYRFAVLAEGGETGAGWGGELVHSFGGGCGPGYHQGRLERGTVLDDRMLSRGFAVSAATLTINQTACNDVLSAETALMVKERVSEVLGAAPRWTMGSGGSGGAIQQLLVAHNYPGILDGLLISATFQDSQLADPVDCRLLNDWFRAGGAPLTEDQRSAVTGARTARSCTVWELAFADVIVADRGCDPSVPAELVYDRETNPDGARCTTWDSMVNVYGRDPDTGAARRTLDNVGVQYGLDALRSGVIDLEQFLDLNGSVGGYDADGHRQPERSVGDPEAIAAAHRTGRLALGGALPDVPILDLRTWNDEAGDFHTSVHSFVVRERIRVAAGDTANHVLWRADRASTAAMYDAGVETMADWLDRAAADRWRRSPRSRTVATRPAAAVDACWTPDGDRIDEPATLEGPGRCHDLYPPSQTTRMAAGAPLDHGGLACALRPLEPADYGEPTGEQLARLAAVFPEGVCDYGAGASRYAEPFAGPWQRFG